MGQDDDLLKVEPLFSRFGDWSGRLASGLSPEDRELNCSHERTGRPLGLLAFVDRQERLPRRTLDPQKRGPKRKLKRTSTRRQSGTGT